MECIWGISKHLSFGVVFVVGVYWVSLWDVVFCLGEGEGGWDLLTEKHYWEGRGGFVFHVRFIKIKKELKLCPTCRFCGKKRHGTTYVLPLSCLSMETLSQVIPAVTQDFNFTIFLKKREQK